jgi:hypothetical protein
MRMMGKSVMDDGQCYCFGMQMAEESIMDNATVAVVQMAGKSIMETEVSMV